MDEHVEGSSNDVDEQFWSLMEGLRTSIPSVPVLLAFLLIAPGRDQGDTPLGSWITGTG